MGRPRKRDFTTDFFDGVFGEEQYWLMGWLFSDGYNSGSSTTLSVHLHDEEVLHKIAQVWHCAPAVPIKGVRAKVLRIHSRHLSDRLTELGCMRRKSLIIRYPIYIQTTEATRAFLRGVFEGDGSLYRMSQRLSTRAEIASGSLLFLQDLQQVIKQHVGLDSKIERKPTGNGCRITFRHYHESYRFMAFIYDTPRLDLTLARKRDLWLAFKARVDNPPPMRTWAINRDRCVAFHLKAPTGEIYYSDAVRPFCVEHGLNFANLAHLVKRDYGFRSVKRWTLPTADELAAAQAAGTIVSRQYIRAD